MNKKSESGAYTKEEVLKKTIEYFKGDEMAGNVYVNKYILKDKDGNLLESSPDDMHRRLASELHRIECKYGTPLSEDDIYDVIKDFKYIVPQGGSISGIGNNEQIVSLSNCFVIGNEHDSYGGILQTDEEQTHIMKRRGGVGHDLSHIRPSGSTVKNSAITSTGLVSYMERYSNTTREVGQDGRRGALMLSLSIQHPDAEHFMDAKLDQGKVTGANISLRITDDFMKSVVNKTSFTQQYPVESKTPKIISEANASKMFDKIVHNAWKSAEPGVLFWDTIINESVPDCYSEFGFKSISTNPCAELPLSKNDSCRLLAINLYSYVSNPFTKEAKFNTSLFKHHCIIAQRLMDDIIDLELEKIDRILEKIESDPEPNRVKLTEKELWESIKKSAIKGRRAGIGITAEGDMLAALGLTYGTSEATEFAVDIQKMLALNVYKGSCLLAKERGSFEVFNHELEMNNPFIKRLSNEDEELGELLKEGRRNIGLLTIAPTGTVSMMTQTTSGIEPVFMVSYRRRRKINPNESGVKVSFVDEKGDSFEEYSVFHHKFITWLEANGYDVEATKHLSDNELNNIIRLSPYNKATSADVDWVEKVRMQGEMQKWVDHSISVTVNLPNDATEEIISKVYMAAWTYGCKGITIYRDGSRNGVMISNKEKKSIEAMDDTTAAKRPKKIECDVMRFQNHHEKWIGFVGLYGETKRPYEIFTGMLDSFTIPNYVESGWVIKEKESNVSRYDFIYIDKDGYEQTVKGLNRAFNPDFWNYARLLSGALRHGMPVVNVNEMVDSLKLDDSLGAWKSGVKRMFKKYIKDGTVAKGIKCPECGNTKLRYQDGCCSCDCGWSKCG